MNCLVIFCFLCLIGTTLANRRFIVEGNGNHVDNNIIKDNENVYNNDSSSTGSSGGSSSGTSGGGSGSSGGTNWAASCDYNGQHHKPGETFPAGDGCNQCTCSPLGPACTTNFCSGKRSAYQRFIVTGSGNTVDGNTITNNENVYNNHSSSSSGGSSGGTSGGSNPAGGNCYYDGKHHNPGDVWVATDGCNKCTCSPLGAACTTHVCSGKKRQSDKRFIVDGDNNEVKGNQISNNENVYNNDTSTGSTSGGTSGGSSSGTSGGSSGGNQWHAPCDYNGQHHNPGETFPDVDGCNKCTCSPLGPACTTHFCSGKRSLGSMLRRFIVDGDNNVVDHNTIENNENVYQSGSGQTTQSTASAGSSGGSSSGGNCYYDGKHHNPGDVWVATDGCNKCTCSPLGAACTTHVCSGKKRQSGEHQRRFIVEGSNIIYDNHIVDNGHDVNLKVNVVKSTAGCTMVGGHYDLAQGFLGSDKCTQWSCTSTGIVFNSRQCPNHKPSQTDAIRCYYNGQQYDYGMTFMHADGCNQCVCNKNAIECTSLNQCTSSTGGCHTSYGTKYSYGQHFPKNDGCNICTCALAGIECTSNTCTQTHPITTQSPTIETSGPVSSTDCIVNNLRVPDGQKFYAKDGCNICECFAGYVECGYDKECGTTALPPVTAPHTTCTISGRVYSEGDVIPLYSCYRCVCHNGQRACQSICGFRK